MEGGGAARARTWPKQWYVRMRLGAGTDTWSAEQGRDGGGHAGVLLGTAGGAEVSRVECSERECLRGVAEVRPSGAVAAAPGRPAWGCEVLGDWAVEQLDGLESGELRGEQPDADAFVLDPVDEDGGGAVLLGGRNTEAVGAGVECGQDNGGAGAGVVAGFDVVVAVEIGVPALDLEDQFLDVADGAVGADLGIDGGDAGERSG